MAGFLGVPPQDITLAASTGNNAMPQCSFSARVAGKQRVEVDGLRLITVSVNWRGTTQARKRTLAEALARSYLKVTKPGSSRAKGYP